MGHVTITPATIELDIAAVDPAELSQPDPKGGDACLRIEIVLWKRAEPADPAHAAVLRARRERRNERRNRSSGKKCDELATVRSHSITSSVRASSGIGGSMPSAFAVLRLITSSNLVENWIGRSPGFSPLRMRST